MSVPPDHLPHPISTPTCAVSVSNSQQALFIDDEPLRKLTRNVLQGEGITSAEISIAVVDDATIHDVNRRFLAHDYPTDVISFLLNDPGEVPGTVPGQSDGSGPQHIDGEIVISAETARRTAEELGSLPEHELALYLVHGLLHLCGYDDQTASDRQQMRQREQTHLQKSGIPANYEH